MKTKVWTISHSTETSKFPTSERKFIMKCADKSIDTTSLNHDSILGVLETLGFRRPKALDFSIPSAAKMLLRARGLLELVGSIGQNF